MGQTVSSLYFEPHTGRPNLGFLTLSTVIIFGLYINTFQISFAQVQDNSMNPFMRKAGFPFSDTVAYWKYHIPGEKLQNKIVAVRDPFKHNTVVFRRVIAVENQWVQRADDGGIIKVPKGHLWIECENGEERTLDSLSKEIGGPISDKLVYGQVTSIIWPIWRRTTFNDLDKYQVLLVNQGGRGHSKVYSSDEIFKRYGIR